MKGNELCLDILIEKQRLNARKALETLNADSFLPNLPEKSQWQRARAATRT